MEQDIRSRKNTSPKNIASRVGEQPIKESSQIFQAYKYNIFLILFLIYLGYVVVYNLYYLHQYQGLFSKLTPQINTAYPSLHGYYVAVQVAHVLKILGALLIGFFVNLKKRISIVLSISYFSAYVLWFFIAEAIYQNIVKDAVHTPGILYDVFISNARLFYPSVFWILYFSISRDIRKKWLTRQ